MREPWLLSGDVLPPEAACRSALNLIHDDGQSAHTPSYEGVFSLLCTPKLFTKLTPFVHQTHTAFLRVL